MSAVGAAVWTNVRARRSTSDCSAVIDDPCEVSVPLMVETDEVTGFRRGRNLDKIGMDAQDTSELFFDDVVVPKENLLGLQEGMGFFQLMQELPQERCQKLPEGLQRIQI